MTTKSLSSMAWGIIALWIRSLTVRVVGRHAVDRFAQEGRSVIYAFWHGSLFILPREQQHSGIVVMVSESRDGDTAAGLLARFGYEVVRGSSKRKGSRAVISLLNALRRGRSVAIAVDGPRGPRHKAKEGVLYLAGRMGVPIVPVATHVNRSWTLEKTWDKFIIPAPFTEGVIQYGQPITVNGISREEIAAKRSELETALCRLTSDTAMIDPAMHAEDRMPVRARS